MGHIHNTLRATITALAIATITLLVGCSTAPPDAGKAAALSAGVEATLASFKAKDPTLPGVLDKSVGWAVFPEVGKGAFLVGGSYGRGEVYEGGERIGFADISEVSGGLTVGGQSFREMIIFLRQEDLDTFKGGNYSLGGNVSAVALSRGGAGTTDPAKGVIAIVEPKGGLMAEMAVSGQRLRFTPLPQ